MKDSLFPSAYTILLKVLLLNGFICCFIACSSDNDRSDAYGNFEATEITVSAESSGKLLSFKVEEGQELARQEVVGLIDSFPLYLKKEQLKAAIRAVRAKTQNVESQIDVLDERKSNLVRERERVKRLMEANAATQKQLDDIEGEIDVVDKQTEATRIQLNSTNEGILSEIKPLQVQIEQVEDQLAKSIIRNPIPGTVLTTYAEEGELTTTGRPLYLIADLKRVFLRAYVSGQQLPKISLKQEVTVLIDDGEGGTTAIPGIISWIADKAEFTPKIVQTKEERVNLVYAVKVAVENDGQVKIGMPGELSFSARQLKLP